MTQFPWGDTLAGIPRCPDAAEVGSGRRGPRIPHVGVLLVHGVGFQKAGDTFRESVGPLIRLLREGGYQGQDPLPDPTRIAAEALPGSDLPFMELDLPRSGSENREHWAITEAFWASSFAPPNLATIITWLGPQGGVASVARRLQSQRPRTAPGPVSRKRQVMSAPLQVLLSVGVTIVLVLYSVLRAVFAILPIQAVRERLIGSIDRFLTEWAGDMRVLLRDEAQAAMVRFRIARAVRALQEFGCTSVVVVAHSGGAVASYMTLTDSEYADLPVNTLVTLGSGLNIAWRLLGLTDDTHPDVARLVGGRLGRELPARIKWRDFWATDDPVPAGPVDEPPPSTSVPIKDDHAPQGRGYRVNNQWHIRGDHGTYFQNDEEFLVPLAEAIDDAVRPPEATPLFAHWAEPSRSVIRKQRLQRVASLSIWRQLGTACAVLAVFGSIAAGLFSAWLDLASGFARPLDDVTRVMSDAWANIPGSDILKGPVAFMRARELWPLSLTGYITWTFILAALTLTMLPQRVDWERAWSGAPVMRPVTFLVSAFIGLVLVVTAFLGIPGLLGLGLTSSPIWNWEPFDAIFRFGIYEPLVASAGKGWAGPIRYLAVFVAFLATASLLAWVGSLLISGLRRRPVPAVAVGALVALGTAWLLLSLVYAPINSRSFGTALLGWLLLILIFNLLSRIGQWRWGHWDEEERWEARSAMAGIGKRRRAGRRMDFAVFGLLGVGLVLAAVGFAIRPLLPDVAWWPLGVAAAMVGIAILVGLAQDDLNGRLDLPGSAPTAVSAVS